MKIDKSSLKKFIKKKEKKVLRVKMVACDA